MGKFAKLFELENDEQVLLTLNYNDQTDDIKLVVKTDVDGFSVELGMEFETEDKAVAAMDSYTPDKINAFRKSAEELIRN